MTAQIIRKDGRPEYAIVPWKDYETLVRKAEELDDTFAYDRAVAELQQGHDELVPAEVVNRLLAGEPPIRVWREYRGLTQSELAARSGLSQSYVAMLERGARRGTIDKLGRLAQALELDTEDLLPQPPEAGA
ncbi:MAG: helix-turn-helix transcriptional regulator [Spiribacter salinus]|uniref:Helix-turn-helix transcriptional regulator n=1 Tax=Spiribacter salinus TaxID=1335746 RepID=A0A540VP96_9GAMM|nr:MAG: helix-turn-helix transcriptional regulator [Spiribacter salinus]